jgi:hypothetical protein
MISLFNGSAHYRSSLQFLVSTLSYFKLSSFHSGTYSTVQYRTRLAYLFPLFYLLTPYCSAYVREYGHLSRPLVHVHFSFLHFFNKVIYFISLLFPSNNLARTQRRLHHHTEQNIQCRLLGTHCASVLQNHEVTDLLKH